MTICSRSTSGYGLNGARSGRWTSGADQGATHNPRGRTRVRRLPGRRHLLRDEPGTPVPCRASRRTPPIGSCVSPMMGNCLSRTSISTSCAPTKYSSTSTTWGRCWTSWLVSTEPDGVHVHVWPTREIVMEGHLGVPLYHRLPARWRERYVRWFYERGIAMWIEKHASFDEWWGDLGTFMRDEVCYRPWTEFEAAFRRRFEVRRREKTS